MKINKFTVYLSLFQWFLLTTVGVFAQDSIVEKKATSHFHTYFTLSAFESHSKLKTTPIDTSLNGFQKYELTKEGQHLGNMGKAYKSFLFENDIQKGFTLGTHAFSHYFTQKDVMFYDVSSPFTELYYVQGSKKEQIFNVLHTQNINERFNVSLRYDIINSIGTYRRQKSDIGNVLTSTHYTSKNKRYRAIGYAAFNKCYNYENGGLLNINDFKEGLFDRPDLYQVKLLSAQNRLKEQAFFVKQFYHFNKKQTTNDTLKKPPSPDYRSALVHTFSYRRESHVYEDTAPDSAYYGIFNFDGIYTNDSIRAHTLENTLSIKQVLMQKKDISPSYIEIGATHQYVDFRTFIHLLRDSIVPGITEKIYVNQYIPHARIIFNPSAHISLSLFSYIVSGDYNKNDYGFEGHLKWQFDNNIIGLQIAQNAYSPSVLQSQYISNNFSWNNNFNKTSSTNIGLSFKGMGFKALLNYNTINKHIYHNINALPTQYDNTIHVVQGILGKDMVYKGIHLDSKFILQDNSAKEVLPVPLFYTHQSLYWGSFLFKKALFAQFGVDFYYHSTYYSYDYMPILRQFYVQNHTQTGHYPIFDFFINMRIKNARIFVKMHHLNAHYLGENMYFTPNYPLQNMAFKYGLSWVFRD